MFFFLRFYLFLDRGEGREKEGEKHLCKRYIDQLPPPRPQLGTWPATQACALTGNQTSDPLALRLVLNALSHTSLGILEFLSRVLHDLIYIVKKIT